MNRTIAFTINMIIVPALLFAGNAGDTGLAFLKIGAGSRAAGMGEAFTAVANDASATFWNPAGLAVLDKGQVSVTHNRWFQDISNNFAAVAFHLGKTVIGLSYIGQHVDGIEVRTYPTTEALAKIDAHDIMLGVSLARSISPVLQAGITVKYLYEKIYLDTAYGVAADAGILYHTPISGLTIGVALQHAGVMSAFRDESTRLPLTVRAGAAYSLLAFADNTLTLATDVVRIIDGSFHLHIGAEVNLRQLIGRIGYVAGYDERGLQTGAGLRFGRYLLDYGYAPFDSGLGDSHRLTFGLTF